MRVDARGWWLQEAGPVTAAAPLAGEHRADVVVVGGGYTGHVGGVGAARARARALRSSSRGVCGEGPSGRNGGFVDHLAHAAPRLRALAGDAAARATIDASLASVRAIGAWCEAEGVDAWFTPAGQIVASAAPAQDGASDAAVGGLPGAGPGRRARRAEPGAAARPDRLAGPARRDVRAVDGHRAARRAWRAGCAAGCSSAGRACSSTAASAPCAAGPAGVTAEGEHGSVRAGAAVLAIGPRAVALPPRCAGA